MTEVLHSSPSSSSSSLSLPTPTHNDAWFETQSVDEEEEGYSRVRVRECDTRDEVKETNKNGDQELSLLALLVTLFRKSFWVACKTDREEICAMEIGWPTNVRHVAHVTFDRFDGFLGLPVEFEPEVPRRAPSASATVFGVSTESMQLSYDPIGNIVPTILLLMQRQLYAQGGLQAEGIFRINAENSQEECVRDQLNRGVVPEGIDVHCLAGLIKAWFRELPTGILDSLSPEEVMQSQSEDDCTALVRRLPPTEAALFNWAINLMADVVQWEHLNKMNAHNIATVFAPNMTQMADPLTALMYAVRVMNFLKTLIVKTLREREDSMIEPAASCPEPSDENGHQSPSQRCVENTAQENEETELVFIAEEPVPENDSDSNELDCITDGEAYSDSTSVEEPYGDCDSCLQVETTIYETEAAGTVDGPKTRVQEDISVSKIGPSSNPNLSTGAGKIKGQQPVDLVVGPVKKSKEMSNLSRINLSTERIEAWC
ncbi:rho GTPase-activating protein 5-like [Cornus florida]|uniref:rho GTPase-activating protein 5-like n=1 Tax=Cornus florida TaxID=4283 RepID=UPI00289AC240|nr:rho GTPase-activating protein 5-like [Cornus florida]